MFRLAHLPVGAQSHQRLPVFPPFDIDVERQLFFFDRELVGDAVAVEVESRSWRARLAGWRTRLQPAWDESVEQRPVVEFIEPSGVSELELALDLGDQARDLQNALALFLQAIAGPFTSTRTW